MKRLRIILEEEIDGQLFRVERVMRYTQLEIGRYNLRDVLVDTLADLEKQLAADTPRKEPK